MSRLTWNAAGTRFYEAGVDRGVLFIGSAPGVPWSGLTGVEENANAGGVKAYFIDGEKYLNVAGAEDFSATISAYTYPDEFSECDGTKRVRPGLMFGQQPRKSFGFSYRTMVGNDTGQEAYKIHLVYNALAEPSDRSASTYSDSIEATEFSWTVSTKPRRVSGYKSTAHVVVDTRKMHPTTIGYVEDLIYGSASTVPRLPTPEELITLFDIPVVFEVIDNEDGSFHVEGPEENVREIGLDQVIIDHPSIQVVNSETFTITY